MRLFLLASIGISILFASAIDQTAPEDVGMEGTWGSTIEADEIIEGVHILSGRLSFSEVDYAVPGPVPLVIQRFYNGDLDASEDGFHIFDYMSFDIGETKFWEKSLFRRIWNWEGHYDEKLKVICHEPSGTSFIYGHRYSARGDKKYIFPFNEASNDLGLTNIGSHEISGQTNYINRTIIKQNNRLYMELGDGSKRVYAYWWDGTYQSLCWGRKIYRVPESSLGHTQSEAALFQKIFSPENIMQPKLPQRYACHPNPPPFAYIPYLANTSGLGALDYTQTPEGDRVQYYYDTNQKLARLVATNHDGSHVYGFVEFLHGKDPNPSHKHRVPLTIRTSDGKTFTYHVGKCGKHNVLQKVTGTGIETREYRYKQIGGKPRLCEIRRPKGPVKVIEYYESGPYLGLVKAVKRPVGSSGKLVTVARFEYNLEVYDFRVEPPRLNSLLDTKVYDAAGACTHFFFKTQDGLRVERIERKLPTSTKSLWIEHFAWGQPKGTSFESGFFLIEKWIEDGSRNILQGVHLDYDHRGNVLTKTSYGNHTGKQTGRITRSKGHLEGPSTSSHYTYSSDGRNLLLSQVVDGVKTTFTYHPGTNLLQSKLTWDNECIVQREFYFYDSAHLCTQIVTDNGSGNKIKEVEGVTERFVTKIQPKQDQPALGQPEEEAKYAEQPDGAQFLIEKRRYAYDASNKPIREELFGKSQDLVYTINRTYDQLGNCISESDPEGHITHYQYDAHSNLVCVKLPKEGFERRYTYDLADRQIQEEQISPGCHITLTRTYDASSNVTSETDALGNKTTYTYDPLNRLTAKENPPLISEQGEHIKSIERYAYDPMGNLTKIIHPDGSSTQQHLTVHGATYFKQLPGGFEEHVTYSPGGRIIEECSQTGLCQKHEYDVFGNITKTSTFDSTGSHLNTIEATYSPFHLLTSTDPMGVVTRYTYNSRGELVQERIDGIDGYLSYTSDSLGRLVETQHYDSGKLTYAEHTNYDRCDRPVETYITDAAGEILTRSSCQYDALGNLIEEHAFAEGTKATTYYSYDSAQRLIYRRDALGNEVIYTYDSPRKDSLGRKVSRKTQLDPMGRKMIETYDAWGNSAYIQSFDETGELVKLTKRSYNSMGLPTYESQESLGDRPPFEIVYQYTPFGKLAAIIEAPGTAKERKTQLQYNSVGQLTQKIKPDGTSLFYTYYFGNLTKRLWSDQGDIDYRYTYDAADRITHIHDGKGNLLLKQLYSKQGCLITDEYGSVKMAHTYTAQGERKTTQLPGNRVISYTYHGPFIASSSYQGIETRIAQRDLCGRIKRIHLPQKIGEITKEYDALGRITSLRAPAFSQHNTFDSASRLITQTTRDPIGSDTGEYTHDALDQLLEERNFNSQSYQYDAFGNRTVHNGQTVDYDILNQIQAGDDLEVEYDKCGHLTRKKGPDLELLFRYDSLGRLIQITSPDHFTYAFTYDPLDRRITSTYTTSIKAHTKHFLYDGMCEIGAMEDERITELRVPLESVDAEISGSYLFYLNGSYFAPIYNSQRNLVALLPLETKAPTYAYRYTGYGERLAWVINGSPIPTQKDPSPWHFSCKRSIRHTPLVAFGLRDYDVELGRWLTPDPLGFEDGLNIYAYVHNNPLMRYDSHGLAGVQDMTSQVSEMSNQLSAMQEASLQSAITNIQNNLHLMTQMWDEWWRSRHLFLGMGMPFESAPPIIDFAMPDPPKLSFTEQALDFIQSDGFRDLALDFGKDIATDAALYALPGVGQALGGIKSAYKGVKYGYKAYKIYKKSRLARNVEKTATAAFRAKRIQKCIAEIKYYVGSDGRAMHNKSKDLIIQSKDGLKEVRFDVKNYHPHSAPHAHVTKYCMVKNKKYLDGKDKRVFFKY